MRLVLLAALACVACHRGPTQFRSTGRLVFDTKPANEASIFLATEAEVLRSSLILERAKDEGHEIDRAAISVARHADTMILDVTVADRDPVVAADTCNRVIRTYIDQRRGMAVMAIQERIEVLAQQLEASPDNAELKRQIDALQTEAHVARSDVRVLEPCKVPRK